MSVHIENVETRGEQDPLPNPQRGCGTLKPGKAYVIGAGFSPDGVLPSWVECRPHVPFREIGTEGEFTRSFRKIDGLTMQLALEEIAEFVPHYPDELVDGREEAHLDALENHFVPGDVYDMRETVTGANGEWADLSPSQKEDIIDALVPDAEVDRHMDRVRFRGVEGGRHYGEIPACGQTDLLMRAGASYYPDPEDYVSEAIRHGVSKAIPVSPNRDPPQVVPGVTRCWIMHPKACEGFGGGIIGYAYLSEVAFTEPEDGEVPDYIREAETAGKLSVRDFEAPPEPEEDERHPAESTIDEWGAEIEAVGGETDASSGEITLGSVVGYAPEGSDVWHTNRDCGGGEFPEEAEQSATAARDGGRRPCGNCCDGEWPEEASNGV